MSDSLSHLRKMKRRQAMAQSKPTSDLSPGDKVDMLEKTLTVFRKEVDMKLKIMQQILTTRNEQVSVQKKLLEREQTLYDTLLGHWKNTPKLAATGLSVNFTSADILEDMEDEENQSDPDYAEGDEFTAGPSRKKSKSSLRRQRNSAKTAPKQNVDVGGVTGTETNENPDDSGMTDAVGVGTSNSDWEGEDEPQNPPVHVELKTEGDDDDDNDFEEYSTSTFVQEFNFGEEANDGNGNEELKKGKRRISNYRSWLLHKTYDSVIEAEQEVKNEGSWGKNSTYSSAQGETKINYRCNKARKDLPCAKALHILCHSDSQKALVFISSDEHSNHVAKERMPLDTQEAIHALFNEGVRKPNTIISNLLHRGIEPPSRIRLANYLHKLRKN